MTPYERRFGGLGRLYGADALGRFQRAHVCVIGLGGVGSWAVEALARSGIGELTLVDMDDVCISNVNRQLHGIQGELGQPKAEALARRVQAINPECRTHAVQSFFLPSTAEEILQPKFDGLIDAIDNAQTKCLLIASCQRKGIPLVTTGGAGGRRDPTAVEVTDLALSSRDRLLQQVRRLLRREYGFPRGDAPFGIECVFSREPQVFPQPDGSICSERPEAGDLRLDCNVGYGTATFVTGTFGFVAASCIVSRLARSLPHGVPSASVQGDG